MLFDLIEKVVPAMDQVALVLVVDQVEFIGHPGLMHLGNGRIQRTSEGMACMYMYTVSNFKVHGRQGRLVAKQWPYTKP